jgi:hypothetical protein
MDFEPSDSNPVTMMGIAYPAIFGKTLLGSVVIEVIEEAVSTVIATGAELTSCPFTIPVTVRLY